MPQRINVPGFGPVDFPDEMTDEQIISAIQENQQQEQPQVKKPVGNIFSTIGDVAKTIGSGAIAAPAAGISGLMSAAGGAFGIKSNPADVVERVSSALTYEPRTSVGEAAVNVVSWPFRKLAEGADIAGGAASEAGAGPAAGAALNTAIQAAPALLLRGAGGKTMPQKVPVKLTPAQERIQAATQAGFKLTPQQGEGGVVARSAASMSGRAQLERELSQANAGRVNALAQEEIGLPAKPVLDKAGIVRKGKEANAVYAEVSRLPNGAFDKVFKQEVSDISNRTGSRTFAGDTNPAVENLKQYYSGLDRFNSADVVAKIKQLRADGHKNQSKIRNPEENAKGYAQIKVADALENMMERHAGAAGQPDLLTRFKSARVQRAKVFAIERSIRGSDISAREIHRAGKSSPLSGNLKTIADSYDSFDRVFQDVSKIRDHGPFSVVDAYVGAGGLVANPALMLTAAARPLARASLRTKRYQNALVPESERYINRLARQDAEFEALLSQQGQQ